MAKDHSEIDSQRAVQALDPVEDYVDGSLIFVDQQCVLKTIYRKIVQNLGKFSL